MSTATQERSPALSARLASALGVDATPLSAPPLELWPAEAQCFVAGRRVDLSQREFDLLAALVVASDRVIRRERLYELVWGQGMRTTRQRDVDVYVRKVRIKLSQAAPDWTFIHTHNRVGYRLAPEKAGPSA